MLNISHVPSEHPLPLTAKHSMCCKVVGAYRCAIAKLSNHTDCKSDRSLHESKQKAMLTVTQDTKPCQCNPSQVQYSIAAMPLVQQHVQKNTKQGNVLTEVRKLSREDHASTG